MKMHGFYSIELCRWHNPLWWRLLWRWLWECLCWWGCSSCSSGPAGAGWTQQLMILKNWGWPYLPMWFHYTCGIISGGNSKASQATQHLLRQSSNPLQTKLQTVQLYSWLGVVNILVSYILSFTKLYCWTIYLFVAGHSTTFEECHTCALIAEGSSMAYSDNTCPQCGSDTTHLTDSSINHYA